MSISSRLIFAFLLFVGTASAQERPSPASPAKGGIVLDVVVASKSGPAVMGLRQQDFTILDNNIPQPITSFRAIVAGRQAQIEFTLLLDAVNVGPASFSYERDQIERFLRADEGRLVHPTTLAIVTDTNLVMEDVFSVDGNKVADWLIQHTPGIRSITSANALAGAAERFQISLRDFHQVAVRESHLPGRKVIIYASPGWPFLSGPGIQLDHKTQQEFFNEIVALSNEFAQGRVALYSIDPLGATDYNQNFIWRDFLKGISKPSQVEAGNLALQVLATHTGGVAFDPINDLAGLMQQCVADTGSYYELYFTPPHAQQPNEYHHLEVRVLQPGLTARTRQGYYSQP